MSLILDALGKAGGAGQMPPGIPQRYGSATSPRRDHKSNRWNLWFSAVGIALLTGMAAGGTWLLNAPDGARAPGLLANATAASLPPTPATASTHGQPQPAGHASAPQTAPVALTTAHANRTPPAISAPLAAPAANWPAVHQAAAPAPQDSALSLPPTTPAPWEDTAAPWPMPPADMGVGQAGQQPIPSLPPGSFVVHDSAPSFTGDTADLDQLIAQTVHELDEAMAAQDMGKVQRQLGRLTDLLPANSVTLLRYQAWTYMHRRQATQARQAYQRILAQLPNDANALLNLAVLDSQQGDTVAADKGLRRVLDTDPDHPDALAMLQRLHLAQP